MSERHEQRRRAHDETTCDDDRPATLAAKRRAYAHHGGSVRGGVRSDLRDARLAKGLTLAAVASAAGVAAETVGRVETGGASKRVALKVLAVVVAAPEKKPATAGDAVRASRLAAGLTQTEFAEVLRVTMGHVSDVERNGHRPGPQMRARLWQEFGCDLSAWHADGFDAADRGDPSPRVAVEVCCG